MSAAPSRLRMPHALALVWGLAVLVLLASWVIPSGAFDRVETVVDGTRRLVTVPGTYHPVPKVRPGLEQALLAPIRGLQHGADLIAFLLVIGGAFAVLTATGALERGIRALAELLRRRPRLEWVLIPALIAAFSLAGSVFGMSEEVIPFVLVFIPLARSLGYDSLTGVAIPFLGSAAGFAAAFLNPFTVGIAQRLSDLPPSGFGYRLVAWFLGTALVTAYVLRHARRVKADPASSPVRDLDLARDAEAEAIEAPAGASGWRAGTVLALLALAIGVLIWGVVAKGWYFDQIGALFLALALASAAVARLGADPTARAFVAGAKDMVGVVLIVACAKALLLIAQEARILDTLLHAASSGVARLPRVLTAQVMFLAQCALNFFIHSGTSQAALTMPIMAPLADLVGITRQTAVFAFQLCEFVNPVLPTSAVTMGVLGAAKIPWERWARWFLPLLLLLGLLSALLLVPPVLFFHWGPA
jgi:uncharacterized ion transporter superfamily protein YfcC